MKRTSKKSLMKERLAGLALAGSILIGADAIVGSYFRNLDRQAEVARDYNQTERVVGKPYEIYSKQLVREYDKVKGFDLRVLNSELEKLNGKPSEKVRADELIMIPVYKD